jgi:hypothetical protein
MPARLAMVPCGLSFHNFGVPTAANAVFNRLKSRTAVRVHGQGAIDLRLTSRRGFDAIVNPNLGDSEYTVHLCNVAFDRRGEFFRRMYFPRVQRGTQGTRQSPGDARNHMIQRCRILGPGKLATILVLIKVFDPAVDSKVERLIETLDQRCPMRPLVLPDFNPTGVSNRHWFSFRYCL